MDPFDEAERRHCEWLDFLTNSVAPVALAAAIAAISIEQSAELATLGLALLTVWIIPRRAHYARYFGRNLRNPNTTLTTSVGLRRAIFFVLSFVLLICVASGWITKDSLEFSLATVSAQAEVTAQYLAQLLARASTG